jgi:hypothetical protein
MAKRFTARGFVAKEIRRAREAEEPRMSRKALGQLVSISGELVAAWENGRQAVLHDHIVNLIKVLDFGPELMVRVVDDLVDGEATPEFEGKWLEAEKDALGFWSFELNFIPGLLQTPEYAQVVLKDETHVNRRLDRQKILDVAAKPMFVAVISEAALRFKVGTPEVMADQLDHLTERAAQDNVIVHVLPMAADACAQMSGPFMVADLDRGRSIGYTASVIGSGDVIEIPEEVAELRARFDTFRSDALNRREPVDLIRKVAEEWRR